MITELTIQQKKTGRLMYVFQATLEYLISILITGTYLATITDAIGISDSLTGIISSIVSLGCLFQMGAVFLPRKRQKRPVIILSLLYQALFLLLYLIPLSSGRETSKTAIFTVTILLGYFMFYWGNPKKTFWFMSMVPYEERGRYIGRMEIFSLIVSILFNFAMSAVVDHFKTLDMLPTAFRICALVMLALSVLHTLVLVIAADVRFPDKEESPFKNFKASLANRKIRQLIGFHVLWNVAYFFATPYYGVYQIKELGFSLTLVSVIGFISSISRIIATKFLGTYGDRHSFASMTKICLYLACASFLINVFTIPANGIFFFCMYSILIYASQAGMGNAQLNMIYDYVEEEKRTDAMAICYALGGLAGFLSTLIASPLVSHIQASGNRFLGIPMYAQQVLSLISCLLMVLCLFYIKVTFRPEDRLSPN